MATGNIYKNLAKTERIVLEICSRIYRQTHTQTRTDRHTRHNTPLPYCEWSNKTEVPNHRLFHLLPPGYYLHYTTLSETKAISFNYLVVAINIISNLLLLTVCSIIIARGSCVTANNVDDIECRQVWTCPNTTHLKVPLPVGVRAPTETWVFEIPQKVNTPNGI